MRIIKCGLAVALVTSSMAAPPAGLVHHWNFDEGPDWHDSPSRSVATNTVALDANGSADASLQNMGGSNWVSGRQFTALGFDGVNEHLSVATNLAGTLGGTASLSFWLRTTQTGAVSAATAPGIAGVAGAGGAQWGWLDDAGRLGLAVDNTTLVRSTNAVNDGEWHHVVLTRNSVSGVGQVYLDGALQLAAPGATGVRASGFTSLARIENGATPKYFAGRLDQVHIFNRIITAGEVATLSTNHAPKCWDIATEGVNNRPFTTASVFSRTYDVERDPVSVWRWTQPAHGTVTHNGDGSFNYSATGGYLGADSFAVTVEDGKGGFHTANLSVTLLSEPPGGGGVPVTQFTDFTTLQANGTNISFGGIRVPRVLDWNKDGKLDLLIGAGGSVWFYLNNGTTNAPSFAASVKVQAAGVDINIGSSTLPITLADMSGDGVNDLVLTDSANKLRVYRNTAASNATPVFAAYVFVKHTNGTDFVAADRRFDLGDWNGDGKPDLVTGTYSGNVQLFLNTGTAADPRFSTGTTLFSGSYQLYPRLHDLNGNGLVDLMRGVNWGDVIYWRDAGSRGLGSSVTFNFTYTDGTSPGLQGLTDGPVVDFGDFTGDGLSDLVMGGQGGAAGNLFITRGVLNTVAENIADIEAIYDLNTNAVGLTLSSNANALLNQVNNANWNLISRIQNGTLGTREALFTALTNHIAKYAFLKYQNLNTTNFHHVPSIVLQNWVMLEYALAATPSRRTNIADVLGLTGPLRTLYLETGLAFGDNGQSLPATYDTIRNFQRRHPRELFPDALLTTDQLYGDGRGGFVWTPNSTKNTFGQWALGSANEWAGDLTTAINKELGAGSANGDYFTFVMGHEVCHSLDGYVNSRANADLRKRWGLTLCTAAGPDVIPGADGWRSVSSTKTNFQAKGYWDGVEATWSTAWSNYWAVGVGTPFRNTSFMRGSIDWFLDNSQESLATQANHHWANGPGRLVGAVDRFRRASGAGLGPLKANINEVATFIDFLSAGMNRVNLVETKYQTSPQQVNWLDHYADLERDDRGYIRTLKVDGRTYRFEVNTNGVVTNVVTSLLAPKNDTVWTFRDTAREFDVLANDSRLEGGSVSLVAVAQPGHGTTTTNSAGKVIYTPVTGYVGNDSFTYSVTASAGGSVSATAFIEVVSTNTPAGPLLVEYWHSISGSAVSDLTSHANFPTNPTVQYYTNGAFELRSGYGDNYGSRARTQFITPATGNYTFWIASDDGGELWFSTNPDAAGKTLIAYETSWAGPREWMKFASQQSAPIALVAGQACYIESLHKEGGGGDNLAVGWMGPAPFNTTNVIGVAQLRQPFAGFAPPRFNSDPLTKSYATLATAYSGSLAGDVADTNVNEVFTFAKLEGAAWLNISAAGALTGTPGEGDAGTNTFTVRVTDSTGFVDDATVRVFVWNPAAPDLNIALAGSAVNLQLSGVVGQHYRIEFQPALPATLGPWPVLTDIVTLAVSPFTVVDGGSNTQRVYRAVGLP